MPDIEPDDRIRYVDAVEITGLSRGYLLAQVKAGSLTRMGPERGGSFEVYLSRTECEALALVRYRRGKATGYWLTMAEAAEQLGVSRQYAGRIRALGWLPAQRAVTGDYLVRRDDALALIMAGVFPGRRGADAAPASP